MKGRRGDSKAEEVGSLCDGGRFIFHEARKGAADVAVGIQPELRHYITGRLPPERAGVDLTLLFPVCVFVVVDSVGVSVGLLFQLRPSTSSIAEPVIPHVVFQPSAHTDPREAPDVGN